MSDWSEERDVDDSTKTKVKYITNPLVFSPEKLIVPLNGSLTMRALNPEDHDLSYTVRMISSYFNAYNPLEPPVEKRKFPHNCTYFGLVNIHSKKQWELKIELSDLIETEEKSNDGKHGFLVFEAIIPMCSSNNRKIVTRFNVPVFLGGEEKEKAARLKEIFSKTAELNKQIQRYKDIVVGEKITTTKNGFLYQGIEVITYEESEKARKIIKEPSLPDNIEEIHKMSDEELRQIKMKKEKKLWLKYKDGEDFVREDWTGEGKKTIEEAEQEELKKKKELEEGEKKKEVEKKKEEEEEKKKKKESVKSKTEIVAKEPIKTEIKKEEPKKIEVKKVNKPTGKKANGKKKKKNPCCSIM